MKYNALVHISTVSQNSDNQRIAIEKYKENSILFDKRIELDFLLFTGSANAEKIKDKITDAINNLEPESELIVYEFSRLARSISHMFTLINILKEKKIRLHILSPAPQILNLKEDSIITSVYIFVFSLAAQLEREIISERTKSGLRRVKEEGLKKDKNFKLGRPIADKKCEKVQEIIKSLYERGFSFPSIQEELFTVHNFEVNSQTIRRFVREKNYEKKPAIKKRKNKEK